jgi:hypothetical protein
VRSEEGVWGEGKQDSPADTAQADTAHMQSRNLPEVIFRLL